MKLIITYLDNSKFINVGDIEMLCEHIKLQCKHNPDEVKSIRIVPYVVKDKKHSERVR